MVIPFVTESRMENSSFSARTRSILPFGCGTSCGVPLHEAPAQSPPDRSGSNRDTDHQNQRQEPELQFHNKSHFFHVLNNRSLINNSPNRQIAPQFTICVSGRKVKKLSSASKRYGGSTKDDGSDGFQIYENGGQHTATLIGQSKPYTASAA